MSTALLSNVTELRDLIVSKVTPGYVKKMWHRVPDLAVVKDRAAFLEAMAKDEGVLDIGCTGALSQRIKAVAKTYHGVDRQDGPWDVVNLDVTPEALPHHADVTLVMASEVLEHLSNPGRFLDTLAARYRGIDVCITVPHAGAYTVKENCEVVNGDHVAWYSYTTLRTLLTRHGFRIGQCAWYNGTPHRAEGLIVVAKG